MRSDNEHKDFSDRASYRELQLLSEIESNPEVNQRQIASRIGIALGLTNVMLRNLAQKGYVRATQASWKRWVYALTPEGFSHKFRLTVAYMHRVMEHYRTVRQTLREELAPLALNEESRVAICGTGEFAELVYLGLKDMGINEIDIFATQLNGESKFLGMPVRETSTLRQQDYDRVVVATLGPLADELTFLLDQDTEPGNVVILFSNGKSKGM